MSILIIIFILLVVIYFVFIRGRDKSSNNAKYNLKENNKERLKENTNFAPANQGETIEPNISEVLSYAKVDKKLEHTIETDPIPTPSRGVRFADTKHQLEYDKRTGKILTSGFLTV